MSDSAPDEFGPIPEPELDLDSMLADLHSNFPADDPDADIGAESDSGDAPPEGEDVPPAEPSPSDVVITDLKMEGLDGLAFLAKVKALYPDTDVIVITGFATMETARESFRKGVFDFVAKPFKLAEILDGVKRIEKERGLVP